MNSLTIIAPEDRLSDLVTERLRAVGHPDPAAWEKGLNPLAKTAPDQNVQRYLVNQQLRLVIGGFPGDTLGVRTCIVDDGTAGDWLRHLEKGVFPAMLKRAGLAQAA